MLPVAFAVLVMFGAGVDGAATWTPAVVAAAAAFALAKHLRAPLPAPPPPAAPHGTLVLVQQRTLFLRAALLALGVVLVESIISGLVSALWSGTTARALNTVVGLPIGLLVIFRLGRWSAHHLPVTRPLLWFAGIAVASRLVRLLLYAATIGAPVGGTGYMVARNAVLGVLIFAMLVLGDLHARRRAMHYPPAWTAVARPPRQWP